MPETETDNSFERLPQRRNLRAAFHNYSGGDYFVTTCTSGRELSFGTIDDGRMHFTTLGQFADDSLKALSTHYSYVAIPLYTVMPNHVHAIISIKARPGDFVPPFRTALGVVVGGYKQSVTRFARRNDIKFTWQKRFHDHIIRGAIDGNRIAEYIMNNIPKWQSDCFHPSNNLHLI